MEETPSRKLVAILYADVAGYSRLTGRDEFGTHQKVMEVLDYASESIKRSQGSVLRYAGDAILAEFSSVVRAVETAVDLQDELAKRNAKESADNAVQLRIGLNVGEVLQDRGEIYGDGVNLAARLESNAEPGGICISAYVFDQISGRVDVSFTDGGDRTFKNMGRPVHVYLWHPTGTSLPRGGRGLSLPDRPSVAVLPFDNMSNDPEQDFFADGITEEIITELSREKDLFVIARHSTFAYKGQSPDIRQVARDLGVRYVLEGSVRKAGNRIRLNAQLVEAETGGHVWADRYDRALEDVFDIQDELTGTISGTLLQKFRDNETQRALQSRPQNLAAYDHQLRAFGLIQKFKKKESEEAIREARKALEIEPDYSRAHAVLAWAHAYRTWSGWGDDHEKEVALCREAALKAVECDKDDFWGYGVLAVAELYSRNHDRARNAIDRAVSLNPNSADSHALRAVILNFTAKPEEALREMELAVRLNPNHPHWYWVGTGRALFLLGRHEEAMPYLERLVDVAGEVLSWRSLLAACYVAAGREARARAEITALLQSKPSLRCRDVLAIVPLRDERANAGFKDLLKAAGLPE